VRILNLTQHTASAEQVAAGVVEPENKELVQGLLTFDTMPTRADVVERAKKLAVVASYHRDCNDTSTVMIGGAPFLMGALEEALTGAWLTPVYAFSVRESAENMSADGCVVKTNVFRHVGFVGVE